MAIIVCSRSDTFRRHIDSSIDGEKLFRNNMELPSGDSNKNLYLIHESTFGRDKVLGYLKEAQCQVDCIAVADDNPSVGALLLFFDLGVRGYCNSYMASEHYSQLIRLMGEGRNWYPPAMMLEVFQLAKRGMDSSNQTECRLDVLTPRERQIAIRVSRGKSNRDVAIECNITERTVKAHLSNIFEKLKIKDRLSLAMYVNQSWHERD